MAIENKAPPLTKPAGAVPLPEAVRCPPCATNSAWHWRIDGVPEGAATVVNGEYARGWNAAREAAWRADAVPAAELSRLAAILDHDGDEHGVGAQIRQLVQQSAAARQPMTTQGEAARPMESAPRDGTMVRMLVEFSEHDVEDGEGPHWTIGAWPGEGDETSDWQFAGWCWSHDHFTEGKGTPIGWLPLTGSQP